MQKRILGTTLALSLAIILGMCYAKAEGTMHNSYTDAVKVCGAEWRASDAKKAVEKGKGREAWNAFRVECIKRNPYHTKKTRSQSAETK